MKRISFLSFAVVILLLACKGKQEGNLSDREILKAPFTLKTLVADIAKENVLMGGAVGIDGGRSDQFNRFDLLRSNATDQELIALTDDTNAVVRCYAFQALVEKNYIDVFPIVISHLSDTAKIRMLNGCLIKRTQNA